MATDFMTLHKPGIGNAASYQVSGRPFVTGAFPVPGLGSAPTVLSFDAVTKKVIVLNSSNHDIRVGFSSLGVSGSNYVTLHKKDGSTHGKIELEVKCTAIYLLSNNSSTSSVDIAAELTNISAHELTNNWSGSAGVG